MNGFTNECFKLPGFGLPHKEEVWIAIVALLSAFVLASHQISGNGLAGVAGSYVYWLVRILIETALFVAALTVVERYIADTTSPVWLYFSAMLLSLVPFTLAITSFDLIVGLPELGIDPALIGSSTQNSSRLGAFALELLFLSDNHAALCGLLFLPRLWSESLAVRHASDDSLSTSAVVSQPGAVKPTVFDLLQPPLRGPVYWVEAQEHYVRVTTAEERRMVLHRFSDAIRELDQADGMQVHRSHWVAFAAVEAVVKDGQAMKLKIRGNSFVPVSRSYRTLVEERFGELRPECS